ncbi:MAG TPA: XRE family transcriptional regulator, partial [Lentisphaeria bacterium]|nr:XRE family transcriptional regulator [Lentisphaeria bacterium]
GDSLYFDSIEEHELVPLTAKVVYLAVFSEK